MEKKEAMNPVQNLAARLYLEMVTRNLQFVDGNVKMSANPSTLATVSLKLSAAFFETEAASVDAAAAAKKEMKISGPDVGSWM